MPSSMTDLFDQLKKLTDNLSDQSLASEIDVLKNEIENRLNFEQVDKMIKQAFIDKERANSVWTQPLINIMVAVLTAVLISYLMSKGAV